MPALSFSCSVLLEDEELDEGWLEEPDWPLVAPAPAEPLVVPLAPPALFFSSVVLELEEAAPEGEDGVVAPEGDEVAPDEDAAPEGGVAVSRVVRVASLSPQAARPRARDTAAARIESFMCSPPWLG
ncbi:MAG: hypothetical protein ACT4P3_07910 [Betaproteobacteria bacterium]